MLIKVNFNEYHVTNNFRMLQFASLNNNHKYKSDTFGISRVVNVGNPFN
jgi:hypothetical protein